MQFISMFLLVNMLSQIFTPTLSWALTSGPSQPEVQSFEPATTTEMVDLFTGDFTYNIPMFELPGPNGGYPFNLLYNGGIASEQEASWVGLGWNINPGAITRQMRGLPDEFNGQSIKTKTDIKPNVTYGVGLSGNLEIFGADISEGTGLRLGVNIYYNNYKGVGYSIEPTLKLQSQEQSDISAGMSLNLSLDSQEGVGMNVSANISESAKENSTSFNVGMGYNSNEGLSSMSMGINVKANDKVTKSMDKFGTETTTTEKINASVGGNSVLSYAAGGYTPAVSMPTEGRNAFIQFKLGADLFGAFPDGAVNGFFNTQYLRNRNKDINTSAYGYLNLQNAGGGSMLDFNREKDGMIRKESPNLAIPVMTCDIYSVTGQGVGGMYRAYRNDVGILHDVNTESHTAGGALGLEPGLGIGPHIGGDLSVNYSKSQSGKWEDHNKINEKYKFKGTYPGVANYEPAYFKAHGEMTSDDLNELDNIGGDQPVRIDLESENGVVNKFPAGEKLIRKDGGQVTPVSYASDKREPRNMLVQPVEQDYTFDKGMYTVKPDGTIYRYTLPAKNTSQVECLYTSGPQSGNTCGPTIGMPVTGGQPTYKYANTNQFYSRKEITYPYAHAFLLTEILGPDYIDADNITGPSDGDFGYWVKFEYRKKVLNNASLNDTDVYKWRAPFDGASYIKGLNTTFEDDKGAYTYGTKEMYYLSKASTKSHIAVFNISSRKDGRGVFSELQDNPAKTGAYSFKLDNIQLFVKNEYLAAPATAKPIKTVNFQYSYELCKGIPNNGGGNDVGTQGTFTNEGGKLTLKKVWFTYQKNQRGSLSPYEFGYSDFNPGYSQNTLDRWGTYRPASGNACKDIEAPYIDQYTNRAEHDKYASAWSMTSIKLPSGGLIKVALEADDYSHVQNKTAMQMVPVASLSPGFSSDGHINHPRWADPNHRKIYFNLEKPIPDNSAATTELNKYFDQTGKLYYKVFMDIRKSSDNRQDYVSGYADIESKGLDTDSKSGNNFTRGFVVLGRHKIGNKSYPYHPFSMAAWQYIRTQNPNLNGFGPYNTDPNTNKSAAMNKVKSLASIVLRIAEIFQGFHSHCYTSNWGENIIIGSSYIRLNSPDKIKVGGGARVKEISLSDEWSEEKSYYGQTYDYTTDEGGIVSSGVAAYEPSIGGDETALRSAKEYPEKIPLKTNNNLFFEYPANESYFPAPTVGYRKVSVKSLATKYAATATDDIEGGYNIPSGIMTTGATVHEFYTAKDFPVITDETEINVRPAKIWIPVPLIGQVNMNHLTASQGYSILLNDMHGKVKKISKYKQDKTGALIPEPISWIKYNYSANTVYNTNATLENPYYKLNNQVTTLVSDKNGVATKASRVMGQDYEFFTDMRQMTINSQTGGIKFNVDVIVLGPLTIPATVPWPNFGYANTEVYLATTNKIIHRAGILTSTEAYNEGSIIKTTNLLFNDLTGQPLLVSVTNDFDDPIYDYQIPAHFNYETAGPAYLGIGMTFDAAVINGVTANALSSAWFPFIAQGDMLLVDNKSVVLNKKFATGKLVFSDATLNGTKTFKIMRSGRRNLTTTMSGNIRTLGDKTNPVLGNPVDGRTP